MLSARLLTPAPQVSYADTSSLSPRAFRRRVHQPNSLACLARHAVKVGIRMSQQLSRTTLRLVCVPTRRPQNPTVLKQLRCRSEPRSGGPLSESLCLKGSPFPQRFEKSSADAQKLLQLLPAKRPNYPKTDTKSPRPTWPCLREPEQLSSARMALATSPSPHLPLQIPPTTRASQPICILHNSLHRKPYKLYKPSKPYKPYKPKPQDKGPRFPCPPTKVARRPRSPPYFRASKQGFRTWALSGVPVGGVSENRGTLVGGSER